MASPVLCHTFCGRGASCRERVVVQLALIEGIDYWHHNYSDGVKLCYLCDKDADISCFTLNGFKILTFSRVCADCFLYKGVARWRL